MLYLPDYAKLHPALQLTQIVRSFVSASLCPPRVLDSSRVLDVAIPAAR